jgi:hypothetical protein
MECGGFTGTIQVYVPKEALTDYIELMESAFGDDCVRALDIRPTVAVHLSLSP